jgi:cobalamin biosynthesis Co2+ chelatase CbiK
MTTKELVYQEIEQIPEPYLSKILEIIQKFREDHIRIWKGRPLLRPEDTRLMDDDLPQEPEWDAVWNEDHKNES